MEFSTSDNTFDFNLLQLLFFVSHRFIKIGPVVDVIAVHLSPQNEKRHINLSDFKSMRCKSFHITCISKS